jgi:hypothetical protein
MTSFPPNFIPIVDAFYEAVAALEPAEISGRAKDLEIVGRAKDLSKAELVEFQDELDEFYPRKDEAERKTERLFRDALADGLIDAWVKEGTEMQVLSDDRESWRPMAFGVPGFESRTHHLTNPGPNDERPVVVERRQFETWLRMAAGMGVSYRRGRPEAADWESVRIALYEKCKEQGGVPSPEIGEGWRTLADAVRFVHGILSDRREKAGETVLKRRVKEMLGDYERNSGLVTN